MNSALKNELLEKNRHTPPNFFVSCARTFWLVANENYALVGFKNVQVCCLTPSDHGDTVLQSCACSNFLVDLLFFALQSTIFALQPMIFALQPTTFCTPTLIFSMFETKNVDYFVENIFHLIFLLEQK